MFENFFRDRDLDLSQAYYQARRAYEVDPQQDLTRVKTRIGLLAATLYAQIHFCQRQTYRRFQREIELHKSRRNYANADYDVLIVLPPRGTLQQSQVDRLLSQTMGLATSVGFAFVSHAQLNTDRVLHGAKRLHRLILEKKRNGRKVLIVSHSFGSAFVRVMLDESRPADLSSIKGWANLSGLIFGSPLFSCSDKWGWLSTSGPGQQSFSMEQKYFKRPMKTHPIKTVHFLGLKSDWNRKERQQRERLRAFGPNDGLIAWEPYRRLQQTVIPLLDQGHVMDLSRFPLTFTQSLSSMVSTLPIPKKPLASSEMREVDFIPSPPTAP